MSATTAAATVTSKPAKPLMGAQVGIPPRRMDFDFNPAETSRYYYDNNPFLSSFMTALSSLFPEGESFFVEAVREYRDKITDPKLRAEVSGFIGQEAMHSKEHEAFNQAATAQGYPVDKLDRDVGKLLAFAAKLPKPVRLAATVCLEHYTAIIAEMLLRDPEVQKMFSPEMKKLWLWHALEENEHKNVAYDVYQQQVGSYALRAGTMIPTTIIFFAVTFWFHGRLLASDGQLTNVRQTVSGLNYIWGRKGKGVFSRLLPQYLDFFRPNFHPSQHDTNALLDEWREKLFGKNGMLKDQIKQPGNQRKH